MDEVFWEMVQEHRRMWRWLSQNPCEGKLAYFELGLFRGRFPENHCFACEFYADTQREFDHSPFRCYCPFYWGNDTNGEPDDGGGCLHPNAFFRLWNRSKVEAERVVYAKEVAEMPLDYDFIVGYLGKER